MPLASFALAVSLALSGQTAIEPQPAPVMPVAQTVEEYVRDYFADEPVMIEIARCESRFRQFDSEGHILKNAAGSSAVGIFQIMSSIHDPVADKLGIDIYTMRGNAEYARYLYENSGTKPWEADLKSKSCWGKTNAAKSLALNRNK